ncbi:MAG: hypothetical protein HOF90_07145 [Euryarchaeota archaeon]|nr:hypothetical protein [Euryarchaeota archaeon]
MNRSIVIPAAVFLLLLSTSMQPIFQPHGEPEEVFAEDLKEGISPSQGREIPDGAAEVLLVGNSYTQANNLETILHQIITPSDSANVSSLSGGGMRLDQHASRMNTPSDQWNTTLSNNDLDWVVFQDQSQVPGFPRGHTNWQDSISGLFDLTTRVDDLGGESVLFMTWGYREGDSSNAERYPDYKTMQGHLRQGYEDYSDNTSDSQSTTWIAPIGLAYENIYDGILNLGGNPLDSTSIFWNLYSGDGMHPSQTGSYLSACVIYSTIYGNTTAGQVDATNIDSTTKLALQQAADDTVFNGTFGYSFPWMAAGWDGPGDSENNASENGTDDAFFAFGGGSGSSFLTDHGTPLFLAMNLTNNDTNPHVVNLSLHSTSNWNATWNLSNSINDGQITVAENSLEWISMTINVPRVVDSVPLAGVLYPWSLKGVNSDDGQEFWWNFSIEVRPFHNVTHSNTGENLSLDPNTDGRIKIKIRNNGNTATRMDVKVQIVKDGQLDPSYPPSNRIEAYGWTAAVFDVFDLTWVDIGQEVEFEIGLLAPDKTESELEVRVFIKSVWGSEPDISTDISASILWQRNASISVTGFNCDRILPMDSCNGSFEVSNLGNFADNFVLEVNNSPSWVSGLVSSQVIYIPLGDSKILTPTQIIVNNGTTAFTSGNISWTLRLINSTVIVSEFNTEIGVAPSPNWIIEETSAEISNGRLSVAYSLVNSGNGPDGLTVTMNVNFGTEQAIIPPDNATWEGGDIGIRSFDIREVPVGEVFRFRAWADIPDTEPYNGTMWLNMTIHSFLDNDVEFIHSANTSFLGIPWQEAAPVNEPLIDWEKVMIHTKNAWNMFGYALIAVVISAFAINYAIKRRILINEKQKLLDQEAGIIPIDKVDDDWMEKFSETNGGAAPELAVSPQMNKEAFAASFASKSGIAQPSAEPVNPDLVNAASSVLEHHDEKQMKDQISRISSDLSTSKLVSSTLVAETSLLPEKEHITTRTNRINHPSQAKSVPLPTTPATKKKNKTVIVGKPTEHTDSHSESKEVNSESSSDSINNDLDL